MIAMAEVYGQEPGLISDNEGKALPRNYVAHELHCSQEVLNTVIKKGIDDKSMEENGTGIQLLNFSHYQFTEYDRQKPYRLKQEETKSVTEQFNIFWEAYPKRKSKGQAEKAFTKLNPSGELLKTILASIEWAKESIDWQKDDGKFIPYPATWLNARGWEDEYEKPPDDKPIKGLKIR